MALRYCLETAHKRLCAKRSFAFKQRKEKWLYRPKETTFHTASKSLFAWHQLASELDQPGEHELAHGNVDEGLS